MALECKKCQKNLTEADLQFNEELLSDTNDFPCVNCTCNADQISFKEMKKGLAIHFLTVALTPIMYAMAMCFAAAISLWPGQDLWWLCFVVLIAMEIVRRIFRFYIKNVAESIMKNWGSIVVDVLTAIWAIFCLLMLMCTFQIKGGEDATTGMTIATAVFKGLTLNFFGWMAILTHIDCAVHFGKNIKEGKGTWVPEYYKTTISSSGDIETTKEGGYYASGTWMIRVLVGIMLPIWGIIYGFVYGLIIFPIKYFRVSKRIQKCCTPVLFKAYRKAVRRKEKESKSN